MAQAELHNRPVDTVVLEHVMDHTAHYLPVQGLIGVFNHHNMLHALHLPFEEAVVQADRAFGNEPLMQEEAYTRGFHRGRILKDVRKIRQGEANPLLHMRGHCFAGARAHGARCAKGAGDRLVCPSD